ncbi:hypothetical protein V6R21_09110 [Limibacter armeniacum]|uniref:hypothetical protein n=1 Tax=Limibacter armeniacum TaxID=466084 RepID=UPI002FE64EDA
MKKTFLFSVLMGMMVLFSTTSVFAGDKDIKGGGSPGAGFLNVGLGVGYYGDIPLFADYEFGITKDVTIGPAIGFGFGANWLSLGAKGRFYFDDFVNLNGKFDLYAGGTLGLIPVVNNHSDHYESGGLFLALNVGGRYHFTNRLGGFLDLSTGASSIGLSFRL